MNWFNVSQWMAMLLYCSLTFFIFPKIASSISKEKNADMMGMVLGFVISISIWYLMGREWAGPISHS